ncbi:MAG TPA: tetratricopeptide repeat protein [Vicinamibacteria bacterium]
MTWYVKASSLVLLIFLIHCADRPAVERESEADPCAIALAPHAGESKEDLAIAHLQEKASRSQRPAAYLERLGWAFVAKARVSYDPGFYKLAEQSALCIESKSPGINEALLLRGHVLHNLHRFQEAEVLARRLVAQRGLSFDFGLLGDVLLEQGKLTEAIDAYQEMMDQKPSPQAYSRSGYVRWLKGDLLGAIELMRMAAGASGSADPESAAWAQVRLALFELQAGRLPVADSLIERALALQPDYAPALLARGRLLLAEGKDEESVSPLARAATLNPTPEYQWLLIDALRGVEREKEAAVVEAQLLERGAVDDERTFALYLATRGKDVETAVRLAERELEARADVFTLDALAWALHAAGRSEEASALSQRALAEGTRDARLFLHAGVIAAALGDSDNARLRLDQATAIERMLLPSERTHLRAAISRTSAD